MGVCDRYILVNGEPVPEPDLMKWAESYERRENHRVGKDRVGQMEISTVFLGIDHGFLWGRQDPSSYKPVLWETMIFGGPLDQEQYRYDSLEKAKAGHQKSVRLAVLMNHWYFTAWYCYFKPFWENHIQPYVDMI